MSYLVASGRKETIKPDEPVWIYHRHPSNGKIPAKPLPPMALTPGSVLELLKKYAAACGIPPATVCVHALRHSSAAERYLAGEDILSIQNLLGHRSLATTQLYLESLVTQSDRGATLLESRFAHLGVTR